MSEPPLAGRRLHFVGIGGAGMSGLAVVAQALGAEVTGSDRADSGYCELLRRAGIEPLIGHDAENLPERAELVVSTAIPEDNPELAAARAAGATVHHRGDLLGELSRLKRSIAVAGAHGKSTTAAMAAHVLLESGRESAFLIGAEVSPGGPNARWGEGDWIVVEADESDRSFLKLARQVAVVTNIELDHHSTYASLGALQDAFAEFAAPAEQRVLGPGLELPGNGQQIGFGIEAGDVSAEELELRPGGSRFLVDGAEVELNVPGRHNVLNALAAIAACQVAGVSTAEAAAALPSFAGAARRFEDHGRGPSGARVVDDYAHHPTELRATLEAGRTLEPRRLVACFQPHLYSRTKALAREFGKALALADVVVVLDVYSAREQPDEFPGVSGLLVARATADAAGGRPVWWLPDMADAEAMLRSALRDGDLLVTLGAGDVDRLAWALGSSAETHQSGKPSGLGAAP